MDLKKTIIENKLFGLRKELKATKESWRRATLKLQIRPLVFSLKNFKKNEPRNPSKLYKQVQLIFGS